jgi:flagellar hook-basal body complex protein FliE
LRKKEAWISMEDKKVTTSEIATAIGGLSGKVTGFLTVQSNKMKEVNLRDTYGEMIEKVNSMVKKANERISEFIAKVTSEVKDVPEQVKDELIKLSKQAEETINKTIEKGTSYVKDVTGSFVISLQEGKKKLLGKKEDVLTK